MRSTSFIAVFALVAAAANPAEAADSAVQPRLGWTMAFGGTTGLTGPSLKLSLDAPLARATDERISLGELDLSEATAAMRLAGVPLWQRDYRMSQNEGGPALEPAPKTSPWYSRQWIWWTGAAIAGTAALAASAGGNDVSGSTCTGVCNETTRSTGSGVTGVGVSEDEDGNPQVAAGCVNGQCVVCPDGDLASSCLLGETMTFERDVGHDEQLNAGTGGMGDLLPLAAQ